MVPRNRRPHTATPNVNSTPLSTQLAENQPAQQQRQIHPESEPLAAEYLKGTVDATVLERRGEQREGIWNSGGIDQD